MRKGLKSLALKKSWWKGRIHKYNLYQLTTIPERAFFRCKSLKKVIIPKSVRTIETEAFAFCEALEEVVISKETEVADGAFGYCGKVRMVRV